MNALLYTGISMFLLGIIGSLLCYRFNRVKMSKLERPSMVVATIGAIILLLWASASFVRDHP